MSLKYIFQKFRIALKIRDEGFNFDTFALFFHLGNGIRHLFWDAGYGFELETVDTSAKAVLIAAGVLTVLLWAVALASGGGA